MIDDKQWVVSGGTINRDDWKYVVLNNGLVLNFHKKINVILNKNCSVALLGLAWQVDPEKKSVEDIILSWSENTKEEEVLNAEETWCGRYVLIVGDYLYQDATSQMSSFYDIKNGNISNSINILTTLSNIKVILPRIRHGIGMDFLPGPNTMYSNIKKILASQVYNIKTGKLHERMLLPHGVKNLSNEELTKEISRYFIHSLREMKSHINGEIKVALTGGYDSRTLLALIKKADIPFQCYTFKTSKSKGADEKIPPLLCQRLGIEYQFILGNKKISKKKYKDYIEHSAGMARDGDLIHYAKGRYDALTKGKESIVLYSGIWEIAIEFYKKSINEQELNINTVLDMFPDVLFDKVKRDSLVWWFTYIQGSKYPKMISDLNRFYWEQRDGCWMSYISQSFDVMDGVTMIQPCNCRLFLSLLLGYEKKDRIKKYHQVEIINYNVPELNDFPYSDSCSQKIICKVIKRLKNEFHRFFKIIAMYGTLKTIKYYILLNERIVSKISIKAKRINQKMGT